MPSRVLAMSAADIRAVCGILGVAGPRGRELGISDQVVARMGDLMSHRGPDGMGLWRSPPPRPNVVLAHRRLAVVDLSAKASQPMHTPDGRFTIVYNGELYNDAEIRRE